jgi:ribulose-5-phosphate 4-epimerase/fuculose-1-phosphate aldolase
VNSVLKDLNVDPREQAVRVELAAFYRLVEYLGWGEGIYNHIAARLPDSPNQFLIKPHALLYDEVTASNLIKVDCRDDVDERLGVNKVGFTTHAPVMRGRPEVNCSIHIHTVPVMAMAAHPLGLRMICQQATGFYGDIAYDEFGGGFAENLNEQERILTALGDKRVLIMRNHGVLITGSSIENTFTWLKRFVLACEVQLTLEAAGHGAVEISPSAAARSAAQMKRHDAGRGGADWPAWLRRLDRLDKSYRD